MHEPADLELLTAQARLVVAEEALACHASTPEHGRPVQPSLDPAAVFWYARLDGHRHTEWSAHFRRPFDARLHGAFVLTAAMLANKVPGARVAFTQSDEILLIGSGAPPTDTQLASLTATEFNRVLLLRFESLQSPPGGTRWATDGDEEKLSQRIKVNI